MKYVYKNITFNYTEGHVGSYLGMTTEENGIGWTMIDIPSNHIIAMKKDGYYKEVEYNEKTYRIPPHREIEDYKPDDGSKLVNINGDITQSWNTDLHIVYIKWMLGRPRTKFEIDIMCDNPYWLFHDIAHKDDVQGAEVCCLYAIREEDVLRDGLRLMSISGYNPEFDEYYYERMCNDFYNRWQRRLDHNIFKKYISEDPENPEDYE